LRLITQVLVFFMGAMAFVSCTDNSIYDGFITHPKIGWHQDSVIAFEVDIKDTTTRYDITITMRNNNDYPYSNLFLFRQIHTKAGVEFYDTAQYLLADKYGKWLGKGVGSLKTSEFTFKNQALRFAKMGTYTFTLQHGMRNEWLVGIEDVGLRLVPVKE
jgi:gliding motility-associated lipoprotein GldH